MSWFGMYQIIGPPGLYIWEVEPMGTHQVLSAVLLPFDFASTKSDCKCHWSTLFLPCYLPTDGNDRKRVKQKNENCPHRIERAGNTHTQLPHLFLLKTVSKIWPSDYVMLLVSQSILTDPSLFLLIEGWQQTWFNQISL